MCISMDIYAQLFNVHENRICINIKFNVHKMSNNIEFCVHYSGIKFNYINVR